jgi:hypothetical protein
MTTAAVLYVANTQNLLLNGLRSASDGEYLKGCPHGKEENHANRSNMELAGDESAIGRAETCG